MRKFEYLKIKVDNFHLEENELYRQGNDGWELVCFKLYINTYWAYFKREIIDENPLKHPMSNAL